MSTVVEIDGLAGWVLLAGPLVVLAMGLAMTLLWPYRLAPAEGSRTAPRSARSAAPAPELRSAMPAAEATTPVTSRPARFPAAPSETGIQTLISATVEEAPVEVADPAPADIETSPARAMIDSALQQIAAGDRIAAAENLRGAILLASQSGDRRLHAAARLELGDIARHEGDLQTACEHWQLARSLFEEEQSPADAAQCEKRMNSNGCPTDWVLNDF